MIKLVLLFGILAVVAAVNDKLTLALGSAMPTTSLNESIPQLNATFCKTAEATFKLRTNEDEIRCQIDTCPHRCFGMNFNVPNPEGKIYRKDIRKYYAKKMLVNDKIRETMLDIAEKNCFPDIGDKGKVISKEQKPQLAIAVIRSIDADTSNDCESFRFVGEIVHCMKNRAMEDCAAV